MSGSGVAVLLAAVVSELGGGDDGALHVTERSMEVSGTSYASCDGTDAQTEVVAAPASFRSRTRASSSASWRHGRMSRRLAWPWRRLWGGWRARLRPGVRPELVPVCSYRARTRVILA